MEVHRSIHRSTVHQFCQTGFKWPETRRWLLRRGGWREQEIQAKQERRKQVIQALVRNDRRWVSQTRYGFGSLLGSGNANRC